MKMTVRTLMLAVVLVVLGTSSVFAQVLYTFGGPAGSAYNPAVINLAANAEGSRELLAPVTICSVTAGAVPSPGTTSSFDVGDQFQILYNGSASWQPLLATTGALSANQVAVFQSAVGTALTVSASADIFQPPTVPPAATPPLQSRVTVTVTQAPGAGIQSCFSIQNLRYDLGNTRLIGNLPAGVPTGTTFGATSFEAYEGGVPPAAPAIQSPPLALAFGVSPSAVLSPGMVTAGFTGTVGMGVAFTTLGTVGAAGYANATGCTTGNATLASVNTSVSATVVTYGNPLCANNAGGLSTVAQVIQNSGLTATGALSIQEGSFATPAPGAMPISLGNSLGGGLLRNFATSGPATTTLLNLAGATTGSQVEVAVSTMPVGSTITFASTASSASPGATLTLTLIGSGTIAGPSGVVTYVVSNNEGPASATAPITVGPSVEIPFTVTEGASAGATGQARYIVRLRPASTSAETPKYPEINAVTVFPSQLPLVLPSVLYDVATNQTTRLFPFVVFNGNTPSSYDTGLAYTNTGKSARVSSAGVATYSVAGAQDGTFTVFFVSSSGTVTSIRSDDAKFPDGSKILSSGKLKVGDTWLALMSDFVTAGTIKGNFTGSLVVVADFPHSQGFAFISQFTNPAGGATMGYVALQQAR